MTGPTTAAELVDLAVAELHELQRRAAMPTAAATAPELAAGWPAFSRSAHRLVTALYSAPSGGGTPLTGPVSPGVPDRNLQRAGDYLGAAADLLDSRDRRSLTGEQRAADAAHVVPHLAAAGYLIAATTAVHPALLDTAAQVAVAIKSWQSPPPAAATAVPPVSLLVDASWDLQRAANHLAAAAMLDARDRRSGPVKHRVADADRSAPHLAAAAHLVAATTAAHPELFANRAEVAVAMRSWQPYPPAQVPAVTTVSSLVDASTVASAPSRNPRTHSAGPDATSPALATVHAALHLWQQAALAVGHQPAPSQSDLLGAARTAGMLTRLAQNLLTAHADATGAAEAITAVSGQLRRAGAGWNAAADVWRTTATGGRTVSPDVREAGAALEAAVRAFARTGADWTSPRDLRAKSSPGLAWQLARTALAAAQAVAERHAALVVRLGRTAALYTQVRHLPVPKTGEEAEQRVSDRLTGRFTAMGSPDAAPLVATYQRLPAAAAAARTAYAALTDPAVDRNPARQQAAGGTARPAARGQQQPLEAAEQTGAVPVTLAGQRWQRTLADVDARLLDDPHYPALAAALDRIQLAGADVPASLAAAAAAQPLPDVHTARALHWLLADVCPAAITPFTDPIGPSRPPAQPAALVAAAAVQKAMPAAPTARR